MWNCGKGARRTGWKTLPSLPKLAAMWIHLLRHGIAIDREDPKCPTDSERFLTEKGRARTQAAVQGIERLEIVPTLFVVSPYVRAQQTADIAMATLAPKAPREETRALLPLADPHEIIALLRSHELAADAVVMCVGHAPNLDRVLVELCGADSDSAFVRLKKAGLASIEAPVGPAPGAGRLHALLPPATLRRLGEKR